MSDLQTTTAYSGCPSSTLLTWRDLAEADLPDHSINVCNLRYPRVSMRLTWAMLMVVENQMSSNICSRSEYTRREHSVKLL